jgi:hypothetical protein
VASTPDTGSVPAASRRVLTIGRATRLCSRAAVCPLKFVLGFGLRLGLQLSKLDQSSRQTAEIRWVFPNALDSDPALSVMKCSAHYVPPFDYLRAMAPLR